MYNKINSCRYRYLFIQRKFLFLVTSNATKTREESRIESTRMVDVFSQDLYLIIFSSNWWARFFHYRSYIRWKNVTFLDNLKPICKSKKAIDISPFARGLCIWIWTITFWEGFHHQILLNSFNYALCWKKCFTLKHLQQILGNMSGWHLPP